MAAPTVANDLAQQLGTIEEADVNVGQISAAVAQHAAAAMGLRRENHSGQAIRQMERAIAICERVEADHPAMAVEGARARMNHSAMLSQAGRHLEALVSIKEAQRGLESVIAWAKDCGPNDRGVLAILKEAEALHCAAIVAEAIEVEPYSESQSPGDTQQESLAAGLHEQLYAKAKTIAENRLPRSHPVASLAKRLGNQRAVCAIPLGAGSVTQGPTKLPPVLERRGLSNADLPINQQLAAPSNRDHRPPPLFAHDEEATGSEAAVAEKHGGGLDKSSHCPSEVSKSPSRSPTRKQQQMMSRHGKNRKGATHHDIFADFITSARADKDARLIAKGGGQHQEEITKRLHQTHRLSNLMLEQSTDDDLKEKRYTKTGHDVFMKNLKKENRSRSDSALLSQARNLRTSPETVEVKNMNRLLYVKPPTPEPVVVKKDPLLHEDLACQMRSSLASLPKTVQML